MLTLEESLPFPKSTDAAEGVAEFCGGITAGHNARLKSYWTFRRMGIKVVNNWADAVDVEFHQQMSV